MYCYSLISFCGLRRFLISALLYSSNCPPRYRATYINQQESPESIHLSIAECCFSATSYIYIGIVFLKLTYCSKTGAKDGENC